MPGSDLICSMPPGAFSIQQACIIGVSLLTWIVAGPLNYNPVEEWFFHRIKEGRPIPVPNSGQQVACHAYSQSAQ